MLPVLLLAGAGAWSLLSGPRPRDALGGMLLAVLLLHNLAYAAVLPMARMSVQVYPALAWLAGAGSLFVLSRLRRDGRRVV